MFVITELVSKCLVAVFPVFTRGDSTADIAIAFFGIVVTVIQGEHIPRKSVVDIGCGSKALLIHLGQLEHGLGMPLFGELFKFREGGVEIFTLEIFLRAGIIGECGETCQT